MIKPKMLRRGDQVAVVSLSGGMLGEDFCRHSVELGSRRLRALGLEPVFLPNALRGVEFLRAHPEARAEDLKTAFRDDAIRGILCAIGGDDTYRLLPYLMEDADFLSSVRQNPKLFSGFSDTTVNHLMFHRLGLQTFYGPSFLCDLAELSGEMLPYTEAAFRHYLEDGDGWVITPSPMWYEERTDFSAAALGTERARHEERHGFELLQGPATFAGELLGGCADSLYDILTSERHGDEAEICQKYRIFPDREEWRGKLLFLETSEEKMPPDKLRRVLEAIEETGAFDEIAGLLVGKPQDERYYEDYKQIYRSVLGRRGLPILYNVNFGHALPRTVLPYGAQARVDARRQRIEIRR